MCLPTRLSLGQKGQALKQGAQFGLKFFQILTFDVHSDVQAFVVETELAVDSRFARRINLALSIWTGEADQIGLSRLASAEKALQDSR